jgi:hypothetical protein
VDVEIVDLEAAVKVWLNAQATLVGPGRPVTNGFILGDARSPAQGVIGDVRVRSGTVSDVADQRRITVRVRAAGRQGPEQRGPRMVVEAAARATAQTLLGLDVPTVVTLPGGGQVRLVHVDPTTAQGPTQTGDNGGELEYSLDATVTAQAV